MVMKSHWDPMGRLDDKTTLPWIGALYTAIVTARIITSLVRSQYKPLFLTVTGGLDPNFYQIYSLWH